ncbi:MAG TPA: class I SAM-dependent methyltransferase [Ktedonobacteraceae bacterium]|nr:class I SAM-dependent methyltransferase [Ktedonobacteraceae bacterium]
MTLVSQHPVETADPRLILDMNYAFARTAMLVAAVRLHLFSVLATEGMDAQTLAQELRTDPDFTARFLKGLHALGLIEQDGAKYRLAPVASHFLVEGKPTYLGGDTSMVMDFMPAWFALDQTLLTHKPYRDLGQADESAAFFAPHTRDLFSLTYSFAKRLVTSLKLRNYERPLRVLDVGAGSASWSSAFAQHYADAQVTAVDLPAVAAQGQQQVAELGLADRYHWIEADIMTASLEPAGYDLIIVAHLCRFLGEQRTRDLLKKLARNCSPDGTLVIVDILLADDRSGPAFALNLDISMLLNTAQGRLSTFQEFAAWLRESGFQAISSLDIASPSPVIVAKRGMV